MSIGITDDHMDCDTTGHTAHRGETGWQMSWLPGRTLDRNQAVTAMVLGEAAAGDPHPGGRAWPFVAGWAAELGLPSAAEAIRMARSHQASSLDADKEAGS
jgi:hypothetical protein